MKAKSILSLLFCMLLSFTLAKSVNAYAATGERTQEEAVAWARTQGENRQPFDGAYGIQCVNLIRAYYSFLGQEPVLGSGYNYVDNYLPEGWERIDYTPGFVPEPGDVMVWAKNQGIARSDGHVAIVLSIVSETQVEIVDQSSGVPSKIEVYNNANYQCVIRPDFPHVEAVEETLLPEIVEYLCQIPASSFEKYEGNEGDSCIFNFDKQGLPGNDNEYIRNGNIGVNGEEYENGFEVWLARWNGSEEISWVKATYPLNGQYSRLTGTTGLIKSYNTTRFDTAVYFYNGDKLLKLYILTPDYCNWDIDVNLTGVQNLTIMVKDNMAVNGGTSFALADLRLTPAEGHT